LHSRRVVTGARAGVKLHPNSPRVRFIPATTCPPIRCIIRLTMTRSYLIAILLPGLASAAPQIGYAQAPDYYQQAARPTLYQPLNVLDGRANTSWCSASADLYAASLTFGFKSAAKIDEVRIYTGNGLDERTFEGFGRAKKLVLRSASSAQILNLSDR